MTTVASAVSVCETSPTTVAPTPRPTGRKWGGRGPGKCPPSPGICIDRGWGGRESEGEKVPREAVWVLVGGWGRGGGLH